MKQTIWLGVLLCALCQQEWRHDDTYYYLKSLVLKVLPLDEWLRSEEDLGKRMLGWIRTLLVKRMLGWI
jgi:hypothetical protein